MMACELGGAGGSDVETVALGHAGVLGVMRHLGMIDGAAPAADGFVTATLPGRDHVVTAPRAGLFEPLVEPGMAVEAGDVLGTLHDLADLAQPPVQIPAPVPGIVVMRLWRPTVSFGTRLVMLLRPDE
jgi:predicted deacylase